MTSLAHIAAAALLANPPLATAAPARSTAASAADSVVPGVPGELRGTVASTDGRPVTRFTVNANSFNDENGAFRILVPPEGDFRVVIRAPGFAPNVIHVQGAAGKKLVMPEITLGQGEEFIGEVLDADTEQPVVAARIALSDPAKIERLRLVRPERLVNAVTTGVGGYYKIGGSPRGLLMLVVAAPGYLTEFVPVNTKERPKTVYLHRGGAISGVVRGTRGEPLAGAQVVAISEVALDGAEVLTDSSGRYRLAGLRPGRYQLAAMSGSKGAAAAPGEIQVDDGRSTSVALDMGGQGRRRPEGPSGPRLAPAATPAQTAMAGRTVDVGEIQLGAAAPPPAPSAAPPPAPPAPRASAKEEQRASRPARPAAPPRSRPKSAAKAAGKSKPGGKQTRVLFDLDEIQIGGASR